MSGLRISLFLLMGLCFVQAGFTQNADIEEIGQKLGRQALDEIRRDQHLSQQQIDQITEEIEGLEKDQASLSEALVTSVERIGQLENKVQAREERLSELFAQKQAAESVLDMRRREIAATLAVLERLSLQPPPALFIPLNETLHSVRSSSLLASAMVDLRARAQTLAQGLENIKQIERLIAREKLQIETDLLQSQMENRRLMLLLEQKKSAQQQSEQQLTVLQEQREVLERRAYSLQDLVVELETASLAPPQILKNEILPQPNLVPLENQFVRQRGHLTRPVAGERLQAFDKGHHGELYKTQGAALITTPASGTVRYAGLFRSYGQLLIIDVGQNYHLILSGMENIYVQQGQIVLAGEPVGIMPTLPDALLEKEDIASQQAILTLYVELRKDGVAIDPDSWWRSTISTTTDDIDLQEIDLRMRPAL